MLLNAWHLFGRLKGTTHTWIASEDISRVHASIAWQDGQWSLCDQSRNGTIVEGNYIQHDRTKLVVGDQIKFGKRSITHWEMVSDSPPASYLESLQDKSKVIALTANPGIPNPEDDGVSFYYADCKWTMERQSIREDLQHGQVLQLQNENWRFVENEALDVTQNYVALSHSAVFKFSLSADEERIGVKIELNQLELDLGERVYHYLLLALARKRLVDVQHNYASGDQGWVATHDLIRDLSREMRREVDGYYLNVQIFRLRKQLCETEPMGYVFSNVIERRRGEIRFAAPQFKIFKEGQCIHEMPFRASA